MEKKKKVKQRICLMIAIIFIVIALLIPFVFAIPSQTVQNKESEEKTFFYVDSTTKTAGSILEMTVNLETIDYNSFLFNLTSNNKTLEEIDISEINDDAEVEKENNSIVISGNKKEMNINEITLYYQISENIDVGETLDFKATIEEYVENPDDENGNDEAETTENGNDNGEENPVETSRKETIEITITIVGNEEELASEKEIANKDEQTKNDNLQNSKVEQQVQNEINRGNMSTGNMQVSTGSTKVSNSNNQGEIVTYNGSSNNYLEELNIEGYAFTTDFMKENTTYFINLEEEVSSLNITAVAEDDEAKVYIYGDEEIGDGKKILISVTAENGSVRTYRVYVLSK